MLKKSFGFKIFTVFLLPLIALGYFSYYFISSKYAEQHKTSVYTLSAQITASITRLIHNIQLERGLSAGYVVATDQHYYQDELLQQYKTTDEAYQNFMHFIKLNTEAKKNIKKILSKQNKTRVKNVLTRMHEIESKRALIQAHKLGFKEVISYYTPINTELLDTIYVLMTVPKNSDGSTLEIYQIQQIKEDAGLERAYLYKQLLSNKRSLEEQDRIKALIADQKRLVRKLKENMLPKDMMLYNRMISVEAQRRVEQFRDDFFHNRLDSQDAKKWFAVSTKRINEFEKLSLAIIGAYQKSMKDIYQRAKQSLYITLLLWVLSGLSFVLLLYMLSKLVKNEAKLVEDLRIAAYSFDAHEAMTITDPNGIILRVNKAFTRITGYDAEEVIGKNPRVLKSFKHPDSFYKQMWQDILTKGYWSGEIYNKRKNNEIYMERLSITAIKNEKGVTTHYIAQFLDISELKEAEQEAIRQASHDFLTGLPNRKSMMLKLKEEFARSQRHHYYNAFLFIDMDDFKKVNDRFGHRIGDILLQKISKRLKIHMRQEDYLARLSGDEFSVILLDLGEDKEQAAINTKKVCSEMIENIAAPYFINGYKVNISVSIGIKIFPDGAKDINDVINQADAAMYQAKKEGKSRFFYYDKHIEKKMKEVMQLEKEIGQGIDTDQFVFYLQPKVNIRTGRITGAELLLRWQHPSRGLLLPDTFLYVIKDIKIMANITAKALHTVCRILKSSQIKIPSTLSINVSTYELSTDEFIESVQEIIKSYGVDPAHIELEILENELIQDFDTVILNMQRLRKFGIKFSIDDFGTGYSSISYLQKLPIDTIKIDKQFIHDIVNVRNQELTCMILDIAKKFGLISIVEGIETKEQLLFARECGADQYQGFYFSEAVDEVQFLHLYEKG